MGTCHKYGCRKNDETLPARGRLNFATGAPMGLVVPQAVPNSFASGPPPNPFGCARLPSQTDNKNRSRPSLHV